MHHFERYFTERAEFLMALAPWSPDPRDYRPPDPNEFRGVLAGAVNYFRDSDKSLVLSELGTLFRVLRWHRQGYHIELSHPESDEAVNAPIPDYAYQQIAPPHKTLYVSLPVCAPSYRIQREYVLDGFYVERRPAHSHGPWPNGPGTSTGVILQAEFVWRMTGAGARMWSCRELEDVPRQTMDLWFEKPSSTIGEALLHQMTVTDSGAEHDYLDLTRVTEEPTRLRALLSLFVRGLRLAHLGEERNV